MSVRSSLSNTTDVALFPTTLSAFFYHGSFRSPDSIGTTLTFGAELIKSSLGRRTYCPVVGYPVISSSIRLTVVNITKPGPTDLICGPPVAYSPLMNLRRFAGFGPLKLRIPANPRNTQTNIAHFRPLIRERDATRPLGGTDHKLPIARVRKVSV